MREHRLDLLFARGRTNSNMERVICLLIGYAFGLIQTGYIYGKINKIDIRQHGSGNAGMTNAMRVMGFKAGAITFLGDCFKAVFAALVIRLIFADSEMPMDLLVLYSGLGVVLGHNFPFYLKFKGGKGIAASVGIMLAFDYKICLLALVLFFTCLFISKYVSLSSLIMMTFFLTVIIVSGQVGIFYEAEGAFLYEVYGVAFVLTLLAFIRHRQNIVRLIHGNENKFTMKKKTENA